MEVSPGGGGGAKQYAEIQEGADGTTSGASPPEEESKSVVFQSRLQAKRFERMQQRQSNPNEERRGSLEMAPHQTTHKQDAMEEERPSSQGKSSALASTTAAPHPHLSHSFHHHFQHQHQNPRSKPTDALESDAHRLMLRGEARRAVMGFEGSVWNAVKTHNLEILRCFFIVEGTQRLLNRRSPELSDGGRSLLHCAAWLGDESIVRFLLENGAQVDAIDMVSSKTTPLLEAVRAGHKEICLVLLQHGADTLHRDSHGDTAFHWAARCGHGTLLLEMALKLEKREGHGAFADIWTAKVRCVWVLGLTTREAGIKDLSLLA